jgi:hypothetical protein
MWVILSLRQMLADTTQVDELWDSMCQSAINLITKNLHMVENDELLLRIKGRVALFMLTMEVCSLMDKLCT